MDAMEEKYPGMPGWVKVFGVVTLAVILVVVAIVVAGPALGIGHGPAGHMPGSH